MLGVPSHFRPLSLAQQQRLEVIYPPLDLDLVIYSCEVSMKCFSESSYEPTLLFIGRLDIQKMPILFIEVAAKIPDVNVRIIGDGPLSGGLKLSVFTDFPELSRRLVWTGALSHEDTQLELLRSSQAILLLTSIFEGVPIVVLEALGTGIPVITTNCGGIREVIEDSVWNASFSEFNYVTRKNQSIYIQRFTHASLILMDCHTMTASVDVVQVFASETKYWLSRLSNESISLGKEESLSKRWRNAARFREKFSTVSFTKRWRDIFQHI